LEELRKVEVLEDGNWVEIQFEYLKVGDKFRMFESTEEEVIGLYGTTEWVVSRGPYRLSADSVWTVDVNYEEEKDLHHLGCPSYPNCDIDPNGCNRIMGKDVEWYGHRD
jgi:hypothetical protein